MEKGIRDCARSLIRLIRKTRLPVLALLPNRPSPVVDRAQALQQTPGGRLRAFPAQSGLCRQMPTYPPPFRGPCREEHEIGWRGTNTFRQTSPPSPGMGVVALLGGSVVPPGAAPPDLPYGRAPCAPWFLEYTHAVTPLFSSSAAREREKRQ